MKQFIDPMIKVLAMGVDDDPEEGRGSGGSSPDIEPYTYLTWKSIFEDFPEILNFDETGEAGTYEDYCAWMIANNFEEFISGPDE